METEALRAFDDSGCALHAPRESEHQLESFGAYWTEEDRKSKPDQMAEDSDDEFELPRPHERGRS